MFKKVLKIKLKVLGAIFIGLACAQLISAYFFGIMAEKQLNSQFKHLTKSTLINVVKHDYSRGWFSANETVVLAVNNQVVKNIMSVLPGGANESAPVLADNMYQISYTTHITHGLLAGWLHGNLFPTIAYTSTHITFSEKLTTILNKFFNGKKALVIDNILYLNKAGKYIVYSPAFNYDEAVSGVKVNWGGLVLKVHYNPNFDKFENFLSIPLFEMFAPTKGAFLFKNFEYSSNSQYSVNDIKVGSTNSTLASLKIELKDTQALQLKFGQIIHLLTGVNSADFLNGIDAIDPTNFTITNVGYHSLSNDENGYFNADAKAGFSSLLTNKKKYGPLNFDLGLNHIASADFSKLLDNLNALGNQEQTTEEARNKTVAKLKTYFTPILIKNPEVILHSFYLQTPDGVIDLSGKATTQNFVASDINDQTQFMKKLLVKLDFNIPKPILAYFFVLQMKFFLTAGNAQMDKQSSEALAKVVNILLDNQIQSWLKKGYLKQDGNLIKSKISMESGVLYLNGVTVK